MFAFFAFLLLAFFKVPLAISFAIPGFIGLILMKGIGPALSLIGEAPYSWTSSYVMCAVPLFILMGQFAFHAGISRELFNGARVWFGKIPGGMAHTTMLACTLFAACTGSSVASAATMSTVAFPEMEKLNYNQRLSSAVISAGGTLGVLIPPSVIFIIYGLVTETSIGDLFIAGILPGILFSTLFLILISVLCKRNPKLGPPSRSYTWKEKFLAIGRISGMVILFVLVMGGLYVGIFAPSEAGAIGAFGAFIVALWKRTSMPALFTALKETAQTTCYILFIMIGAMIFNTFLTITGVPTTIADWVSGLPVPPMVIMICIITMYIPMGMFIDPLGMILLTVPVLFPVITKLGFDGVWFGVIITVLIELAMITPPVAINLYVVHGVTKVPLEDVSRGILPFAIVFFIGIAILVAFPDIVTWLPYLTKK